MKETVELHQLLNNKKSDFKKQQSKGNTIAPKLQDKVTRKRKKKELNLILQQGSD